MPRWSSKDLPSLSGTTAVVTGANSGIGLVTARELARHGAAVTLAVRTPEKGERAATTIREEVPGADVRVARLDLGSLVSVQQLAEGWSGPLDLLVNNAGLMSPPRHRQTADGFELQFGTNHLGHFALTGRLLPALLEAPSPRVVTVASIAHRNGTAAVVEGNPPQGYRPSRSYGNSKLANLLFAFELQRRASAAGEALTSTAAHPGVSSTNLVTSEQGLGSIPGVRLVAPLVLRMAVQSVAAGAEPTLYAATVAEPGSYTGPQRLRETRGPVGPATASPLARDAQLAARLWERSEELTAVRFDWSRRTSTR
jgi:NAD(P)-dependent dehydrogenase (short-subunit alcohol dehydrogenase family)